MLLNLLTLLLLTVQCLCCQFHHPRTTPSFSAITSECSNTAGCISRPPITRDILVPESPWSSGVILGNDMLFGSSLTGRLFQESFSMEYFWSNTRMPVLFSQAMKSLLHDIPNSIFVEIGPHPVLSNYIASLDNSLSITAPMRRSKSVESFHEVRTFLSAIGDLIVDGCNRVDFAVLNPQNTSRTPDPSPAYPFARKSVPYHPEFYDVKTDLTRRRNGPLNDPILGINSLTHPALAQHIIRDESIMPAAGYLEMVSVFYFHSAFEFDARYLWKVDFEHIMPLFSDRVLRVQVAHEGHYWSHPRLHAQGYMSPLVPTNDGDLNLDIIRGRCQVLDIKGAVDNLPIRTIHSLNNDRILRENGLLRSIRESVSTSHWMLLKRHRRTYKNTIYSAGNYNFHPVVFDSCLHALVHPVFTRNSNPSVYYLPSSVETVALHKSFKKQNLPPTLYTYAKLCRWDPEFLIWDLSILDAYGSRICTLTGLGVSLHPISPYVRSERHFKLIRQVKGNQQRSGTGADSSPELVLHFFQAHACPNLPRIQTTCVENGSMNYSEACLTIFRGVLKMITEVDHKQVVRVFIVYQGALAIQVLVLTLKESPDLPDIETECQKIEAPTSVFLDYTFGTMDDEPSILSGRVRKIRFDPNSRPEDQGLVCPTFDVVLVFGIASNWQPLTVMENLNRLLEPGGYLIIGQGPEQSAKNRSQPRREVKEEGAAETFAISAGSFWQQTALHANISRVELYPITANLDTFALETQKPSWPALPWNSATTEVPRVLDFAPGNILQHQRTIREFDDVPLWICATFGIDDGAALGFSRSLRRERNYPVYLVLFDPIWSAHTRLSIIGDLSESPDVEQELLIDVHGNAYVPLTHLSLVVGGLRGFVGYIVDSGTSAWLKGEFVVGVVASDQIANHFLVHEGQISASPASTSRDVHAASAVPIFLLAFSMGTDSIRNPDRLRGRKVLVTNAHEPTGRWLTTILLHHGVVPQTSSSEPTKIPLETIRQSHFIFSGYSSQEDLQVIQSGMTPDALAVWWNSSAPSCEVRRNPCIVGDAIGAMNLAALKPPLGSEIVSPSPEAHLPRNPLPVHAPLFKSDKSYLLVGGIGSLGLHIAWWMYQRGARRIILTSRSGEASLARDKNTAAIRLLTFLRTTPDLDLRLEECDAASSSATLTLVNSISPPVAGCILLAVRFSDRAFLSHTEDTFYVPFAAKEGAFRALEQALELMSLDFLIALSSVTGLFGSPGQTNYAGANTAVDALVQSYPNAFSIIAPAILDSNFLLNEKNLASDPRFTMWTAWGITSQQLCDCMEDGILALNHGGPSSMYLPDVDWEKLQHQLGDSPMYAHFVKGYKASQEPISKSSTSSMMDSVRHMVLKTLDVDPNEFDSEVPFTSYGLDSLSAGRLSFMLRPYAAITQVQLLADTSLDELYQRIELAEKSVSDPANNNKSQFDWTALNQSGKTVVPLVEGEGNPLIVIHGTSGNIVALLPLQERFDSPLWAIQTTPEIPFDSMEEMARFYFEKIKALRPVGPYRLAGFSGITLLAFQVARTFEQNGDHVVQFVMLDHFPTLYTLPSLFHLDEETIATTLPSRALLQQNLDLLVDLYRRDPSPSRATLAEELTNAFNGMSVREFARSYYEVFVKVVTMFTRFLSTGLPDDGTKVRIRLERWLAEVKAPVTVIVAENGFRQAVSPPDREDLGTRTSFPDARIVVVDSGHFSMYENDSVVEELQNGW
ncbi:hypothetical protein B0H17DRAFT_1138758 [Mycena rosella]|uniref:PKS/mFAS DH domain-containing protein n=1 Tax=Mycena rosella TaxID=1033263 RepID=A0AAD7GD98_MYCRO|nr:hypothetical protein B0H17DRAFT_1138758 [Mycena rosella]